MEMDAPPPLPRTIAHLIPKAQIVSHWSALVENFNMSPDDFYYLLEQAILKRQIPLCETQSVGWKEGGLLSTQREYLRLVRDRFFCDFCAAPFGSGFFFSSWLCAYPRRLTFLHYIGMALTIFFLPVFLVKILGFFLGVTVLFLGLFVLSQVIRNGLFRNEQQAEEFFSGLTIIGAIYDVYFRTLSYYEMDTATMFQSAAHKAFLEAIDEATKGKIVRPLTEDERKPILREFFGR